MLTLALLSTLLLAASPTAVADESARSTVTSSAPYLMPLEPYAGYQPQTRCTRKPKPGVLMLADWLVARGGGYGAITRPCTGTSTSEHKESRAFDWLLDATNPDDQVLAQALAVPQEDGAEQAPLGGLRELGETVELVVLLGPVDLVPHVDRPEREEGVQVQPGPGTAIVAHSDS